MVLGYFLRFEKNISSLYQINMNLNSGNSDAILIFMMDGETDTYYYAMKKMYRADCA